MNGAPILLRQQSAQEGLIMWAIIVATLVLFPPAGSDRVQSDCSVETLNATPLETPALDTFNQQVAAYLRLQDAVRRQLAMQRLFVDPEDLFRAMRSLQAGIRAARPDARPGSIFNPAIGALIRTRLQQRLLVCDYAVEDVLAFLNEERAAGAPGPKVNGSFPWMVGSAMWPTLLAVLPPLPPQLEYRFVDRDLVLIDIEADLVIDVLKNALPAPGFRVRNRDLS
jgi:hypothetical protein